MSATTTQLLSSGEFRKLRYDTVPVKSASANVSFYTNNSKIAKFWVVTLLSQMSELRNERVAMKAVGMCSASLQEGYDVMWSQHARTHTHTPQETLGYDAARVGHYLPTFRDNLTVFIFKVGAVQDSLKFNPYPANAENMMSS